MSENKKDTKKILCENLSPVEKALLMQTTLTPGFKIIIKMANEGCSRYLQDIARLDSEQSDYERLVVERGRRARNVTEWSDLLFASIYGHVDSIKSQEVAEHQDAEEAVNNVFGIHPAKVGESNDVVKKVYGIHPAKPAKKKQQ
jgi:hypothetical protein